MKIDELLKVEPERIDTNLDGLADLMDCSSANWAYDCEHKQTTARLYRKVIKEHCFDGRRIWYLAILIFDEIEVAVIQRAGREGDDHEDVLVIDKHQYIKACKYLDSCVEYNYHIPRVIEPDKNVTTFYGKDLKDYFEYY